MKDILINIALGIITLACFVFLIWFFGGIEGLIVLGLFVITLTGISTGIILWGRLGGLS